MQHWVDALGALPCLVGVAVTVLNNQDITCGKSTKASTALELSALFVVTLFPYFIKTASQPTEDDFLPVIEKRAAKGPQISNRMVSKIREWADVVRTNQGYARDLLSKEKKREQRRREEQEGIV